MNQQILSKLSLNEQSRYQEFIEFKKRHGTILSNYLLEEFDIDNDGKITFRDFKLNQEYSSDSWKS